MSLNEVGISSDLVAPTLDANIDGILMTGVQLDGGSSVNLMNAETMLALHLNGLKETTVVLRMADQSRVSPMGVLPSVKNNNCRINIFH